jgi:glycosyltransferase involved in cell wall biosynthesis
MLKVSVIVPTYNRVNRLKHVLAALSQQTFSPREVEVLVVSDGSSDGTHEYVRRLHMPYQLTLIEQANQGPAAARNNGIAHASGEYILFVDDEDARTGWQAGSRARANAHTSEFPHVALGTLGTGHAGKTVPKHSEWYMGANCTPILHRQYLVGPPACACKRRLRPDIPPGRGC